MTPQKGLQKYQTLEVLNIKKAMRDYFEFLLKKGGMPHQSLVFLREEIDRLSSEIETLKRQLGHNSAPRISARV